MPARPPLRRWTPSYPIFRKTSPNMGVLSRKRSIPSLCRMTRSNKHNVMVPTCHGFSCQVLVLLYFYFLDCIILFNVGFPVGAAISLVHGLVFWVGFPSRGNPIFYFLNLLFPVRIG